MVFSTQSIRKEKPKKANGIHVAFDHEGKGYLARPDKKAKAKPAKVEEPVAEEKPVVSKKSKK